MPTSDFPTSLVAGNWKLNGSRDSVQALAKAIASGSQDLNSEVLICPSDVHIAEVAQALQGSKVKLGAQNASVHQQGAYTGETAVTMLKEYACEYVIIGHSERRQLFGESEQLCAEKFAAVLDAGLCPIFCIGETLAERDAGNTEAVIKQQLHAVFNVSGQQAFAAAVIAYEPVWAIGTGKTASPEQAQAVHAYIRGLLTEQDSASAAKVRILYGGSVKADNADALFAMPDINGGLIGGAALDAESFLAICKAAA